MTRDPPRLLDDPDAPDLARALREARGDVLSPEAVARVQAGLCAAGVAAPGAGAATGARPPAAKLLGGALRVGLAGLVLAGAAGVASMRHATGRADTPPASTTATADRGPAASPEGLASGAAAQPEEASSASPTSDAPPVATSVARPSPHATAAGGTPSPREGLLLLEARRAVEVDPARALVLVHEHEVEFPHSQLGPERARIAAEARRRLPK